MVKSPDVLVMIFDEVSISKWNFYNRKSPARSIFTLILHAAYSFVPNCKVVVCVCVGGGGSNKIHQGENYQDFLKWGGGGEVDLRGFFPKFAIWPPPPPTIIHKRVVVSCTILPCNCCDYRVISPLRNAEFKKRYICSCNEIIYIRKGFVLLFFHSFVKTIKIFRITPSRVTCV